MSEPAIRAEGLSKRYRLGALNAPYDTLRDQIVRLARRDARVTRGRETLWALDDVSFDVREGEVVGIVGRNGAGKTTLLKILSRITRPTRGRAELHGRVGSLLEVGTGFHPELTGRENIFLNGAILGMSRQETTQRFDEIVEFAGVQKFVETPVKRYSSGMYVRLAFSVAAHLEPEILLVDEVLAVGDLEFQRRCLGKMESIGREGRTVLFVSHNMPAVARLCPRALLIEGGRLALDGDSTDVLAAYVGSGVGNAAERRWGDPASAPGDEHARLRSVRVVNRSGDLAAVVDVREDTGIEIAFDVLKRELPIRPQLMLVNEQGVHAFNAMDPDSRWDEPVAPGSYATTAWIPGNLLNEGLMVVSVFLSTPAPGKTVQHAVERDAVAFQVTDPIEGDSAKGSWSGQWHGAVRPLLEWTSG